MNRPPTTKNREERPWRVGSGASGEITFTRRRQTARRSRDPGRAAVLAQNLNWIVSTAKVLLLKIIKDWTIEYRMELFYLKEESI